MSSAVQFFNKRGEGVKLEGFGIYQPKVDLKVRFSIRHIVDSDIVSTLNSSGAFTGEIINKGNIGKTTNELVALWNEEHPEDVVS